MPACLSACFSYLPSILYIRRCMLLVDRHASAFLFHCIIGIYLPTDGIGISALRSLPIYITKYPGDHLVDTQAELSFQWPSNMPHT